MLDPADATQAPAIVAAGIKPAAVELLHLRTSPGALPDAIALAEPPSRRDC